jgi:hypothetical protein
MLSSLEGGCDWPNIFGRHSKNRLQPMRMRPFDRLGKMARTDGFAGKAANVLRPIATIDDAVPQFFRYNYTS